jgi:N-acylglucosamine-6-phosphate 2-epimerase
MADVDSIENGLIAASLGCEWVGTTLYGYTEQTTQQNPPGYGLISPLREQLSDQVTLICEGGIKSPDSASQALERGADLVVVGTAITGVDLQVAEYLRTLNRQSG